MTTSTELGTSATGRNSWANDSVNERVAKQKAAQNGGC